jgi:glucose/arabinose dehydrogenase
MKVRGALLALAALAGTMPAAADDIPLLGAKLTQVGTFTQPVALATRTGDTRIFIAEQTGRVKDLTGATILDLSGEVSTGGEQGLLGLTFSPTGETMYVNFTDRVGVGRTHVTAFAMVGGMPTGTRTEILIVDQPFANHNGGAIAFGHDGFLYIALGDGGSGGDPLNNGQRLDTLLGKILRVDPRPGSNPPYVIPLTNPFLGTVGAKPEIWSYGLRNPWRFSFDRATGDLWIGDVGQNLWEEIDHRPVASFGGENYGWNRMEGSHPYGTGTPPPNHVGPVYDYPHNGMDCSVTGGYVYRGARIPTLQGRYLFADFCGGRVKALVEIAGLISLPFDLNLAPGAISSFGEDALGELYVLSLNGGVYRLDPA